MHVIKRCHLPAGIVGVREAQMTTTRAPYITRRWTDAEEATLRSMVEAGMDARTIGKELNRSFMSIQARVKKLNLAVSRLRSDSLPSSATLWRWDPKGERER